MEEGLEEMRAHLASFIVNLREYKEEKVVGKGAYGKVYLATNTRTGQRHAVKELFIDHLEGRQLKLFCREVQILAKCQSLFLLPFHGFTLSHPYSIVTEFIPNGSLYEALRHRQNSPTLTATNKTIIAMGIARGMMHLHELNIIHRDLKSLNILLDENLYPKICDFGIARFRGDANQLITQQIGTPHWMAPELFQGGAYDTRVDVYSYGIILWELISEDTPFKGRCPVQIMSAVCTMHERPVIPFGVPKELEELVRLCWAQTPEERPTFKMIYKLFHDKKVAFQGTNFDEVDKCIREIELDEERVRMKKGVEFPRVEERELLEVPSLIRESPQPKRTTITGLSEMPGQKVEFVVKMLRAMVHKSDNVIDEVTKHDLFKSLPFGDSKMFTVLYNLVFDMLKRKPASVPPAKIQVMIDANSNRSKELLSLIALMPKNEDTSDLLMRNWKVFVTEDASVLLMSILNEILSEELLQNHGKEYKDLMTKVFETTDRNILKAAYTLLLKHFDEQCVSPMLPKHLTMKGIGTAALLVLSRCKNVSLTEEHFHGLFRLGMRQEACQILTKAAKRLEYAQIIVSHSNLWLSAGKLNDESRLMVMYELTKHKELALSDSVLIQMCQCLDKCLSMERPPLGTVAIILKRMPIKPLVANYCESSGFTERFLKAATERNEYQTAVLFARTLSKFGIPKSFDILLDKVPSSDTETDMSAVPLVCAAGREKQLLHVRDENVVVNAIVTHHHE